MTGQSRRKFSVVGIIALFACVIAIALIFLIQTCGRGRLERRELEVARAFGEARGRYLFRVLGRPLSVACRRPAADSAYRWRGAGDFVVNLISTGHEGSGCVARV